MTEKKTININFGTSKALRRTSAYINQFKESIGHFRVTYTLCLCFKTSSRAKPFEFISK